MFLASHDSMKDIFRWQTSKELKLVQLDKVLCEWFIAMSSEENLLLSL